MKDLLLKLWANLLAWLGKTKRPPQLAPAPKPIAPVIHKYTRKGKRRKYRPWGAKKLIG